MRRQPSLTSIPMPQLRRRQLSRVLRGWRAVSSKKRSKSPSFVRFTQAAVVLSFLGRAETSWRVYKLICPSPVQRTHRTRTDDVPLSLFGQLQQYNASVLAWRHARVFVFSLLLPIATWAFLRRNRADKETADLPLVFGTHYEFRGNSTELEWQTSFAMEGKRRSPSPASIRTSISQPRVPRRQIREQQLMPKFC